MSEERLTVVVVSISTEDGGDTGRRASRPHIGEVCAREFARNGVHVVLVDGDRASLTLVADDIRAEGGSVDAICADLTNWNALEQAAAECLVIRPRVDVLVTCHSDMEIGGIEATSAETWGRVVNFNLLGAVYATKAFLPLLKKSPRGSIVHMGSIDGILGNPQIPSYSAAKGGLVPLTHVMAEEFSRYGIRVNCVARAMFCEKDAPRSPRHEELIKHTPIPRPAYPEEVASVVRFLASAEASYVNGVVMPVDGGRSGITQGSRPTP